MDSRVVSVMAAASRIYGNPSAFNATGRAARELLEKSRAQVAAFLHARPSEIVFTASGSEANNLAILGSLVNFSDGTALTTPIEHPSVLEAFKRASQVQTKYLVVDAQGFVDVASVAAQITPDCRLVSVMYANNEIGTIEPIKKMAKYIRSLPAESRPLFHVDACQAAGFLDMNVQTLGVDLLTFNGSKIYGPRGIGVLYVRRGVSLVPQVVGGRQEHGLRAGTENLPGIVGLAKAISLIKAGQSKKIAAVRDHTIAQLSKHILEALLTGPVGDDRLPNNIHICIPGLESEQLLLELDKYNISAGSGSACTAHAVEPSHVLKAIGVSATHINGALRLSLGRETTKKDMDYVVKILAKVILNLRKRYL